MVAEDIHLKKCFPQPPLTAFRRQNNLRNYLIKSKVAPPPPILPQREMKGMKKCGKACTACPFILTGKNVKIDKLGKLRKNSNGSLSTSFTLFNARNVIKNTLEQQDAS